MKMKGKIAVFIAFLTLLIVGCRTIYVPVGSNSNTEVNVKDSTVFHYIDSVRIHEATRYKEMGWLGDSLKIEGQHSRMWAVADTNKEVILGGLEEDKFEEKTKIVYKDRWHVRDSLVYVEKPVPVEVTKEVKHIPWIYRILSLFGFLSIVWFGIKTYLKFRKV